jgi:hypothetical protein
MYNNKSLSKMFKDLNDITDQLVIGRQRKKPSKTEHKISRKTLTYNMQDTLIVILPLCSAGKRAAAAVKVRARAVCRGSGMRKAKIWRCGAQRYHKRWRGVRCNQKRAKGKRVGRRF